jgi:hypothetical protein
MSYNYYLSLTTEPAKRFRIAAQTQSGLYNVYAVMKEPNDVKFDPIMRQQADLAVDPELCQPNEVFVFKNLRSLAQAEQCIRVAGSAEPDWNQFLQFISINRSRGNYHTGICSTEGISHRATMMLQQSVRDLPLEEFGMVSCERKNIQIIKYTQNENSASIWILLHGNPEPHLAASFPLSEKSLALQRLREFRTRANRQTLDPTIDFIDSEPIPLHERVDMDEANRYNSRSLLLDLDRYKDVVSEEKNDEKSDSECDVDDSNNADSCPEPPVDYSEKPPLIYKE